jgi:hypothetical protein
MHIKNQKLKIAVIRLLSGFPVLLTSLIAHVRINPRNLLACDYALSLQSAPARNASICSEYEPATKTASHPQWGRICLF